MFLFFRNLLLKIKKIKEALISLNESKKITLTQNHNTTVFPDVDLEIAKCYYELQSYNKAENVLLKALNSNIVLLEPNNSNSDKKKLEKLIFLSKIYNIQGKKTEIIKVKDSIIKNYQKQDDLDFNIIENRLGLYEKEQEINKNKLEKTNINTRLDSLSNLNFSYNNQGFLFHKIVTDGRYYKFYYNDNTTKTIDIGYNFIEANPLLLSKNRN